MSKDTNNTNTTKMSDFVVASKLGTGAFSEVFKCVRKSDKKTYALKKVKM